MSRSVRATARVLGLIALVACMAPGLAAGADPQPEGARAPDAPPAVGMDLHWTAPAECPDETAVRRDIEELAGRRIAASDGTGIRVEGLVVRQDAGRWTVELTLTRAVGEAASRRVEGLTCAEVARAAVSIVALALEPPLPPAPPPPPPAPPPPPPVRPAPPPPPPARRAAWSLFATGGVDGWALPRPAPGLGVGGGLVFGDNRIEVRTTAWLPRTADLTPSSGAEISLFAADARYCRALAGSRVELSACAGFEGGFMHAQGFGLRKNDDQLGAWAAPELAAVVLLRVSRHFALSIEADGLAPLIRDRFRVENDAVLHRPPPVDGRGLFAARLEGL